MTWQSDDELFGLMRRELFTAVIGDLLDQMGFHHQFFPPRIQPLDRAMVTAGRAMPVLEADYFASEHSGESGLGGKPFGLMFQALDELKPNEVYVATGGSPRYALWGELMSTRAMHLKAAGAILNGYVRDTHGIVQMKFPTFSYGSYAQDQAFRGKVIDFRVAVDIDGVRVNPGDIVFGDVDGVVVIPREAEREAISRSLEKVSTENRVRLAIEGGMSTRDAFEKFGVM